MYQVLLGGVSQASTTDPVARSRQSARCPGVLGTSQAGGEVGRRSAWPGMRSERTYVSAVERSRWNVSLSTWSGLQKLSELRSGRYCERHSVHSSALPEDPHKAWKVTPSLTTTPEPEVKGHEPHTSTNCLFYISPPTPLNFSTNAAIF